MSVNHNLKTGKLIIDGAYANMCAASAGQQFDYVSLRRFLEKETGTMQGFGEVHFVTGLPENASASLLRFNSMLQSAPPGGPQFIVHAFPMKQTIVKCPGCHSSFGKTVQKRVDVEIVLQMLHRPESYDRLVLLAGDGDFTGALQCVKNLGKEVVVCAFTGCTNTALQSVADRVIWLDHYWPLVQRKRTA